MIVRVYDEEKVELYDGLGILEVEELDEDEDYCFCITGRCCEGDEEPLEILADTFDILTDEGVVLETEEDYN